MISHEPPLTAVAGLPLWSTIAEAYRTIFNNGAGLVRVVAVPFVLGTVIDVLMYTLAPPWSDLLQLFLFNLLWAGFIIGWLRFLLLEDRADLRVFPRLNRRLARLAGYALLISLLDVPLVLGWYTFGEGVQSIPHSDVLYWLAYLATAFVKLRFSFIFAATAVDERYGVVLAWRHSSSIALPFFTAIALTVLLPIVALTYGFAAVNAGDYATAVALWILWQATVWFFEATYITIVAIAFRRVTGWVPAPDKTILERFE